MHALLAPWLRASWTIEQVREFFEDEYRELEEALRVLRLAGHRITP